MSAVCLNREPKGKMIDRRRFRLAQVLTLASAREAMRDGFGGSVDNARGPLVFGFLGTPDAASNKTSHGPSRGVKHGQLSDLRLV